MKKGFFASIIVSLAMILNACMPNGLFKSDSQLINAQFDKVLEALDESDEAALKLLFAPKAIELDPDFDESMQLLLEYYKGSNASYKDDGGLVASKSRDDDFERKVIDKSFDVTTSMNTYRFAVSLVVTDDANNDNVGIWSLYIIHMADDSDPACGYWGDGKNTPGINIGIPSPNENS